MFSWGKACLIIASRALKKHMQGEYPYLQFVRKKTLYFQT